MLATHTMTQTNWTYRPEIDGLRALAVLAVVLFHYRVPGFSGGFVGVDVFFVISGYLITGLILKERGEGRFSLRQFYERRIRRIFPALFAMLAVAT
ncbi:MAG TPA: acyltransferase, partial [Steroidobacteraceae bacterium]